MILTYADPITLAAIATGVGSLIGGGTALAGALGSKPSAPQMPAPAPPVQSPTGAPGANATGPAPSFLAAAAAPAAAQSGGGKTLLGQ